MFGERSISEMEWYYAKHGERQGPVSLATLRSMVVTGEVAQTDLVWRKGMADWIPAGQVPEISGVNSDPPATPVASPASGTQTPQAEVGIAGPVAHERIPNYLVQSILVTILFCWAFGIPAIVYAAKVDGLVARGDIAGAMEASKKAKTWAWVSFGVGIPITILAGLSFWGLLE